MSVEAISWALTEAPIPRDRRDASSLAIVLVGLANHAGPDGRNAFPAIATLSTYTRLSTRSVQYALRALEELDLIRASDPEIVAAYIKRADRRPHGWDLALERRGPTRAVDKSDASVDNPDTAVQPLHPAQARGVQRRASGVQTTTSRGADTAPEPSLNRPRTTRARRSDIGADERSPAPEQPCG
ncbi:hypothetical protein FNH05_12690, partial [Amycolatopsis rhizosphaerae]